jgi:serine/threonine protein kinase
LFARLPTPTAVGRYRLLDVIGEGGMGVVYSAHEPRLDRTVALKMARSRGRDGAATLRILHEARALARIQHPHVTAVYEVDEVDGLTFCAMELVDGVDLRRWAAELREPVAPILAVGLQVARGLAAAHAAGVVHRDVKPRNVVVGRDGRARIVDFGLASIVGAGEPVRLGPSGTPGYMAPEQLASEPVDARCDQFALCLTIVELLRARALHTGSDPASVARALHGGVVRDAVHGLLIEPGLAALLRRGTALDPADRFPDMHALEAELEPLVTCDGAHHGFR